MLMADGWWLMVDGGARWPNDGDVHVCICVHTAVTAQNERGRLPAAPVLEFYRGAVFFSVDNWGRAHFDRKPDSELLGHVDLVFISYRPDHCDQLQKCVV